MGQGISSSRPRRVAAGITVGLVLAAVGAGQDYPTVPYREAGAHAGEIVWVEGTVLRTENSSEGTFLLFSANEEFVRVLIPTANRSAFEGSIRHRYVGKKIRAVGQVTPYLSGFVVGVNEPRRIRIVEESG